MTYCRTLTDTQVINVLKAEYSRMHSYTDGGEIWQAAKELHQEAREELLRRGLEPGDYLVADEI